MNAPIPEPQVYPTDFRHRCELCGKAIEPVLRGIKQQLVPHKFNNGKSICHDCDTAISIQRRTPNAIDEEYKRQLRLSYGIKL